MAYVRKRGPFSFQVCYKENGKAVVDATFETEAEALKRVADIELDKSVGRQVDRKRGLVKVIEALELYENTEACTKAGYADNGKYRYKMWKDAKNVNKLQFLNENLSTITTAKVKVWMKKRLEKVSPSTVNRDLNELSAFFSWCRAHYELDWFVNPVADVQRPRSDDERDRIVQRDSDEETKLIEFLKKSNTKFLYAAFVLAIETGVRRKELCSITWNQVYDLDTDAPYITLQASQTKTVKRRSLPLSEASVEAIRELKKIHADLKEDDVRLQERRKTSRKTKNYNVLLLGIKPNGLSQAFRKARVAAGIEDLRLHDLRHCATTRLFDDGFGVTEVASVTGHSSLQSLKRYTNHAAQNLARKMRQNKGQ